MGKIKKNRCSWSGDDPIYIQYHDEEWGVPIFDDKRIFEFLFQIPEIMIIFDLL